MVKATRAPSEMPLSSPAVHDLVRWPQPTGSQRVERRGKVSSGGTFEIYREHQSCRRNVKVLSHWPMIRGTRNIRSR
ncbi:hypothetical protein E2C01_076474 [Portunus trituberculatus]|uniref:Uncharacterized protein n=1 Tax=Portunus trituberculatus TaxID=210409 RepID=A0A5B7IM50_PORTR|nr:hypothetical protein [Portunus trituberculatus]